MKTFLILCTLLSAYWLPADETLENLEVQKIAYQEAPPLERLHMQLSEEVMAVGGKLWFQGTLQTAQPESKVLYVEILNSQQTVVQGIYSIKNGLFKGQLQLPDTLSGGWYQIRAYTQWMRNQGETSYWSHPLMIVNPYEDKLAVQQATQAKRSGEINFFPEGGNYVEDLPNRILVQLPVGIAKKVTSARLINLQDSLPLAEVRFQSGQSDLNITPETDKDYALEIYLSGGDTLLQALPKPQQQGVALQADFDQNGLQIEAHHLEKGKYALVLRTNDTFHFSENYRGPAFSYQFDEEELPAGIFEINVEDESGKILAQRMLYHEPQGEAITIALGKVKYHPREKVEATLSLPGTDNTIPLSVTVRKINPLTPYFEDKEHAFGLIAKDDIPASLNETQRMKWINQALIARKSPFEPVQHDEATQPIRYNKEEESLTVSGKVKGTNDKNPAGRVVVLSVPGNNPYFEYDFVNADGGFQIPVKENVVGKKDIILQMADTSVQVQWTLDEKFMQKNTFETENFPLVPEDALKEVLQSYTRRAQIRTQYDFYHAQDSTSAQNKADFRFYGAPNYEISLENYIELPNFVEVNRELMPGIRLRESKGSYNLDVFDIPSRTFLPGEPSVFLDGVLVHELSYIVNLRPSEIELIETVNRRTYYGEYRFDGTIAIYTKEGNAYLPTLSPSAKQEKRSLYTAYDPFSPTDSLQSHEPDFRTLLYWQPSIKLSHEPYTLNFSNADELGEFEIVVEGTAEDGARIYGRKTYTVSLSTL